MPEASRQVTGNIRVGMRQVRNSDMVIEVKDDEKAVGAVAKEIRRVARWSPV